MMTALHSIYTIKHALNAVLTEFHSWDGFGSGFGMLRRSERRFNRSVNPCWTQWTARWKQGTQSGLRNMLANRIHARLLMPLLYLISWLYSPDCNLQSGTDMIRDVSTVWIKTGWPRTGDSRKQNKEYTRCQIIVFKKMNRRRPACPFSCPISTM